MAAFSDLYARVQNAAHATDATTAKAYVNDALQEIVAQTRHNVKKVTKTLVAGQSTYDTTSDWSLSDFVSIHSILYFGSAGASGYVIEPTSLEAVTQLLAISSTSGYARAYAMMGLTKVLIAPAAQGSDSVDLYYGAKPTTLVADGDIPTEIPTYFHDLITLRATSMLAEIENADMAERYYSKYQIRLARFEAWLQKRDANLPQVIQVGYPGRRRLTSHDRSQYWSPNA